MERITRRITYKENQTLFLPKNHPLSFLSKYQLNVILKGRSVKDMDRFLCPIYCRRCGGSFTKHSDDRFTCCNKKNTKIKCRNGCSYFELKCYFIDLYDHHVIHINKSSSPTPDHILITFNENKRLEERTILLASPNKCDRNKEGYLIPFYSDDHKFKLNVAQLRDTFICPYDYSRPEPDFNKIQPTYPIQNSHHYQYSFNKLNAPNAPNIEYRTYKTNTSNRMNRTNRINEINSVNERNRMNTFNEINAINGMNSTYDIFGASDSDSTLNDGDSDTKNKTSSKKFYLSESINDKNDTVNKPNLNSTDLTTFKFNYTRNKNKRIRIENEIENKNKNENENENENEGEWKGDNEYTHKCRQDNKYEYKYSSNHDEDYKYNSNSNDNNNNYKYHLNSNDNSNNYKYHSNDNDNNNNYKYHLNSNDNSNNYKYHSNDNDNNNNYKYHSNDNDNNNNYKYHSMIMIITITTNTI